MTTPSHPAHDLLLRAHSPTTSADIYASHVKHRPLLLRPSSPDPKSPSNAREARRVARSKADIAARRTAKRTSKAGRNSLQAPTRPLSAKTKRSLGVYEVPADQRRWDLYIGLHELWCGYIREVLGVSAQPKLSADVAGPMLASADYHGAIMTVARSGCVSRVGLEGIVVKDTRHTFELVTRRNKLVTIPKEGTVFKFEVPNAGTCLEKGDQGTLSFELYGDNFRTSAPDRANKKFKLHISPLV